MHKAATEKAAPEKIRIHTDGACRGNPGPGGWGAVLQHGAHRKEISGFDSATTNNRMELMAAIASLESLKRPCEVELYTDSQYLRLGITEWMARWKLNGWRTAGRKPVQNRDLWERLDQAARLHKLHWHWVKGHSGDPDNERADQLATGAISSGP